MNLVPSITLFPEPAVISKHLVIVRDNMIHREITDPFVVHAMFAVNLIGDIKSGVCFKCRPVTLVKTELAAVTNFRMN